MDSKCRDKVPNSFTDEGRGRGGWKPLDPDLG